jgi:hypothetical protein
MALEDPELMRIAAALAPFDDAALAAMANKGLVRRARKDLEKARPTPLAGPALQVEDASVTLASPPSQMKCSCGAGGSVPPCRHILAAVMFLREFAASAPTSAAGSAPAPDPVAELLAITQDDLQSWAGKPLFRRASRTPRDGFSFDTGDMLTLRLPAQNVVIRFVAGGGLPHMICSCHEPGPCEHKIATILAFWGAHNRPVVLAEDSALNASAGAPRSRPEVLDSVRGTLAELVTLGVSRASEAARQRLQTLAVSAHGVDLPRLERMLRACADELRLLLSRDAQGSAESVLAMAARTWCLMRALAMPNPFLVGVHRSRYDPVAGELDLIGLGAKQWRTRSGYEGLTVYFWDTKSSRWNTWTDSRPLGSPGFDPVSRYTQEGPWSGLTSPREASRKRLRVTSAFRNAAGRLSGRAATRALATAPADPLAAPIMDNWAALAPQLERFYGGGFHDRTEGDQVVLLKPANLLPATFDENRQQIVRPMLDTAGRILPLVLRYDDRTPGAVEHIERIESNSLRGVLGLLVGTSEGLAVEPITLFPPDGPGHITLDGTPALKPAAKSSPPAAESPESDELEDPEDLEESLGVPAMQASRLTCVLRALTDDLSALGESGLAVHRDESRFLAAAAQFEVIQLNSVATPLKRLAQALENARRSGTATLTPAALLLETLYITHVATQQELLARWVAALR